MVLTDTHTHLYYETDSQKQALLVQRCLNNNVNRLFLPNVDAASISLVRLLTDRYSGMCFPMMGLHPCSVKGNWETELAAMKEHLNDPNIVAIGEIGIDLYWDKTTLPQQITAFKEQIGWAKSLNLPIVIHCRDAFDEVYKVLSEEKDEKLRGIFHCFSGTFEQAEKVIDLGFYLGIGGVVTYKNSGLDKVVEKVNLKHIVLETDSPYLTPVPHRGKPNESSYLLLIAEKVADLHHADLQTVANITTENSKRVFGI